MGGEDGKTLLEKKNVVHIFRKMGDKVIRMTTTPLIRLQNDLQVLKEKLIGGPSLAEEHPELGLAVQYAHLENSPICSCPQDWAPHTLGSAGA